MKIAELMKEYELEIDDIRWYLATSMSRRLLGYRDSEYVLTKYIWSGALEDDLYDMEEKFISELRADYQQGLLDEPKIREILQEIATVRGRRYGELFKD